MGIFDKIFGKKNNDSGKPNNDKLIGLLIKYSKNRSQDNYRKVYTELTNGNSFLILPSDNDGKPTNGWDTLEKKSTLKLTSVYDLDGLKVLGAFTSESTLLEWSKKETEYTSMKSKDVVDFCQTNGIERIVIDSDLPTMFVLERNKDNIKSEIIQEETTVQVGTPMNPISGEHLKQFQNNFSKINSIIEVYHYAMIRNKESILMLGFRLETYSDNAWTACLNAVQNSMEGEKLDLPLEMFMLEDEGWYQTVKGIEKALIYKK